MKAPLALLPLITVLALGCNNSPDNQERVRNDTANATAAITSDVKAAAQGVRDGLKRNSTDVVDINTASKSQLESLSGVTPTMADNIIAGRPYTDSAELRRKHIVPADVYANISGRLTTSH